MPRAEWADRIALLFWVGLALPVLEEVAFRGGIQPGLAGVLPARWGPLSAANLITSGLFAALHLVSHPPLWAAATFFPSLVFGGLRERCQCLAWPVGVHAFYNTGYFVLFGLPT
jgi:hypothetical protein